MISKWIAITFSFFCAQAFAGETVEGKRVTIRHDSGLTLSAKRAKDLLELAIPIYEKHLPYQLPAEEKLVFNLGSTKEALESLINETGAEKGDNRFAFTSNLSQQSYILFQPRLDPDYLKVVNYLPQCLELLIFHEGVHQFLLRAKAPYSEWWPQWYAEGMAEFLAEKCLIEILGYTKDQILSRNTLDYRLAQALQNKRVRPLSSLLYVGCRLPNYGSEFFDLYRHFGSFYDFLSEEETLFKKLHLNIKEQKSPPYGAGTDAKTSCQKRDETFEKMLTDVFSVVPKLEENWHAYIKRQKSSWYEVFGFSQFQGEEIIAASFPEMSTKAIRATLVAEATFDLNCEIYILNIGHKNAEIDFAYTNKSLLRLTFWTEGSISLQVFSNGKFDEKLRSVAEIPSDKLQTEKWVPIRLRVENQTIKVDVDAVNYLSTPLPSGFMIKDTQWGIGVYDGVARFQKIKVNGVEVK